MNNKFLPTLKSQEILNKTKLLLLKFLISWNYLTFSVSQRSEDRDDFKRHFVWLLNEFVFCMEKNMKKKNEKIEEWNKSWKTQYININCLQLACYIIHNKGLTTYNRIVYI